MSAYWRWIGVLNLKHSHNMTIGDPLAPQSNMSVDFPACNKQLDCWIKKGIFPGWGERNFEFVVCTPSLSPGELKDVWGVHRTVIGVDAGCVAAMLGGYPEDDGMYREPLAVQGKSSTFYPYPSKWDEKPDIPDQQPKEKLSWNELRSEGMIKIVPPPDYEKRLLTYTTDAVNIAGLNDLYFFGNRRGCVVSSGLGDGGYRVFLFRNEKEVAVRVLFLEEDLCKESKS